MSFPNLLSIIICFRTKARASSSADKVASELNLKYRLARHDLLETTAVEWSQVKYR
ncbi:hypothetical protein [Nitrosomonas sp. sh817]|uniref:hypothetical protein n=1 Tax=Nitrosomonas sp. sh817 TaxID=3070658 RepID=UPI0027DAFECA|nr:hypothetical protein [Nitrosomonas sp. sh817]WMJ08176.1 hypothetical protein RBH92_12185 [Nitrosomonas sp. sh817]